MNSTVLRLSEHRGVLAAKMPSTISRFRGPACWCYTGEAASSENYHSSDDRTVDMFVVPANPGLDYTCSQEVPLMTRPADNDGSLCICVCLCVRANLCSDNNFPGK